MKEEVGSFEPILRSGDHNQFPPPPPPHNHHHHHHHHRRRRRLHRNLIHKLLIYRKSEGYFDLI